MLNTFGSSTPILFVVFVETIGVFWFYGVSRWAPAVSAQNSDQDWSGVCCRFCDDVEQMIGSRPSLFWRVCWQYISPAFLLVWIQQIRVPQFDINIL